MSQQSIPNDNSCQYDTLCNFWAGAAQRHDRPYPDGAWANPLTFKGASVLPFLIIEVSSDVH
jgi:hypothetical protein